MRFISIKINNKYIAIPYSKEYEIEPTLINKITQVSKHKNKLVDGYINYKGKIIDVFDISSLYGKNRLKKFDGLIFIHKNKKTFAIEYEGFYKIIDEIKDETVLKFEDHFSST